MISRLLLALTILAGTSTPPRGPAPVMTIGRLHYDGGGDWYSNPSSLPNLLNAVRTRTTLRVAGEEKVVTLSDDDLWNVPYIYMTGHGNVHWSDRDLATLRRYLQQGGFLHADDNYGMDVSIRRELARLFPDHPSGGSPLGPPDLPPDLRFPQGHPQNSRARRQAGSGLRDFPGWAAGGVLLLSVGPGRRVGRSGSAPRYPGKTGSCPENGRESLRVRGRVRRMTAPATHRALQRLGRPLRGRNQAGLTALGLGTVALVLGLVAWTVRLGWLSVPYWVLLAWGLALLGLFAVGYIAWETQRRLSTTRLAGRLEELGAWRRGTLTALLDSSAAGTSGALLALADRAHAQEIERKGPAAVEPIARPVRLLLTTGAACLLLGAAAFTSAGPMRGPAAALWHPRRAWEATVAPVRLRAAAELVDRGQPVQFQLEAVGRKVATLWLRSPGETWKAVGLRLDSLGHASFTTQPLQSDLFARLTSGSRSSDTVIVRVRLAGVSRIADRHRPLPGVSGSGERAGAHRRRYPHPAGGHAA